MGCSSSISEFIFKLHCACFGKSESEVCGLDTLQFYTSMQNYASYPWDFGDNTTPPRSTLHTSLRRKEPSRYP